MLPLRLLYYKDYPLLFNIHTCLRKFDFGIYVVITSIEPLRVYVYNGDILLRFCSENYLPLNVKNVNKYVVGDDYTPLWEVFKNLFFKFTPFF